MGLLLGSLDLFYPLLITSVISFVYALFMQSWKIMLISAILLYPEAWYFSGSPQFTWTIFVPLIQVMLAVIFYLMKRKQIKT